MRFQVQRLFWVGLAISPVISLAGAPNGLPHAALSALTGGLGSLAALAAAFTHMMIPATTGRKSLGLLRRSALKAPPPDLPDAVTRRAQLSVALRSAAPEDVAAPPSRKTATVRLLRRTMEAAGRHSLDDLDDNDTLELILLKRLLSAPPAKAGALAQLFARPDVVLDLRDEFQDLGRRRDAYDLDRAALTATETLWRQTQWHYGDMIEACLALGVPDPDLWHQMVLADPSSAQAYWCVQQPGCDRATVAIFMAHVARTGGLIHAIAARDKVRIDQLRAILKRWTAGGYTRSALALTRGDLGEDPTGIMSAMLDAAARRLNSPRWPEPCGLFTLTEGRRPRDRSHWDLRQARLLRAPAPAAYLDVHRI